MRYCAARPRSSPLAACFVVVSLFGCSHAQGGSDDTLEDNDVPARCAAGRVRGPGGDCMPAGIQGCAAPFVGDDGLCHPAMAACPAGTIPRLDEGCIPVGLPRCAPEFLGGDGLCRPTIAKCPAGTFALPALGCATVDGPNGCGGSPWGGISDRPGTVFVDPSSTSDGGDGTLARPLKSLARAMALAPDGGTIALAEGIYRDPVVIARRLEIAGRCPSRVKLAGVSTAAERPAVVTVLPGGEVTLRGLTIGGEGVGVFVEAMGAATLDRVHVTRAESFGAIAAGGGARLDVARSIIEGSRRVGTDGSAGVLAERGAMLSIAASAVIGNRVAGIALAHPFTKATVVGSLIEGTLPMENLYRGEGIVVDGGAALSIESSAIVGNRMTGVLVTGQSSASLTGVLVEGTQSGPVGMSYGLGAYAAAGARIDVTSSVFINNVEAGIAVVGMGAEARVSQTLVQDTTATTAERSPFGGVGALIARGAAMQIGDSALWRNRTAGLFVLDAAAQLEVAGCLIEGTSLLDGRGAASGIEAIDAQLTVKSSAIRGNAGAGVSIGYSASDASVIGNLIEAQRDGGEGAAQGVRVYRGARAVLESNFVTGNRDVGVYAGTDGPPGELRMTGEFVQSTLDGAREGQGIGVAVAGYDLTLAASVLRGSGVAGLALFAARADVHGTRVDGVLGAGTPSDESGSVSVDGDGVMALGGSTLDLTDVKVSGCARAGILYEESSGKLAGVSASRNLLGLVLQGASRAEIDARSVFAGNKLTDELLDAALPVPRAPPPLP